jgi:hypothetical protein
MATAEDPFFPTSGTAEQMFMLMLVERLDKADDLIVGLQKEIGRLKTAVGIDCPPPVIHPAAQELLAALRQKVKDADSEEQSSEVAHLQTVGFPVEIRSSAARSALFHLTDSAYDTPVYKIYKCINFLEKAGDEAVPEVVEWLQVHMRPWMEAKNLNRVGANTIFLT